MEPLKKVFTVEFSNGNTVTPGNFSSVSGTFTVTLDVSVQRITTEGFTTQAEARIVLLDAETLLLTDVPTGCATMITFSFNNDILTTFLSLAEARQCGAGGFSETDVWQRVSATLSTPNDKRILETQMSHGAVGALVGKRM